MLHLTRVILLTNIGVSLSSDKPHSGQMFGLIKRGQEREERERERKGDERK